MIHPDYKLQENNQCSEEISLPSMTSMKTLKEQLGGAQSACTNCKA